MIERLYRRFPSFKIAGRNLSRTQIRSGLAVAGIVIGVVAIASLGIFGTTLRQSASNSFEELGRQVVVSPAQSEGVSSLSNRDVRNVDRAARGATLSRIRQDQGVVRYNAEESFATLYAVSNPAVAFDARDGRIPDSLRGGVVVGASMADRLDVEVGGSVEVGNATYRVRAVLAPQGDFSPLGVDSAVLVPMDDVSGTGYDKILLTADDGEAANETAVAVRESLNRRERRVSVLDMSAIRDQIANFFQTMNLFLIGIGSISLVVAGVSIGNVMLMSVVERREEIGVLRAVGFTKRDVLKILLAEALVLGVVGGCIGIGLSLMAGFTINWFTLGDPMLALQPVNLGYVALAFGFGVATSVLSGFYPAWKAANERPVEVLRS